LPQPLLPMMARKEPASTVRSMPSSTILSPNCLRTSRKAKAAGRGSLSRGIARASGSAGSGAARIAAIVAVVMSTFRGLEGGMPLERQALEQAGETVGQFAEQRVDEDRQHHDIDQQELA